MIDEDQISKTDWAVWRNDIVTRTFLSVVANRREEVKEGLVEGHYGVDKEYLVNIGRARAFREILELVLDITSQEKQTDEVSSLQLQSDSEAETTRY